MLEILLFLGETEELCLGETEELCLFLGSKHNVSHFSTKEHFSINTGNLYFSFLR